MIDVTAIRITFRSRYPLTLVVKRIGFGFVIMLVTCYITYRINGWFSGNRMYLAYGLLVIAYDHVMSRLFDQTPITKRISHKITEFFEGVYLLVRDLFR